MAAFGGFGLATANADRTIGATGSPKETNRNQFIEPEDGVYNEKFNADDKNEHDRTPDSSDDSIEHEKKLNKEVGDLARIYSNHSGVSRHSDYEKNPFEFEERKGSSLDPHSENFSPRAWAKALLNIQSGDPEKWKQRTSGFAYRNLNVHGFGEATDYQKSVSNVMFEVVGYAKKLVGLGKKRKIQILRNFEGIVHSGEMLVVLGPPGSGCSTFLKTIAGETDGIYVDAKSELNYEGISAKEMHTRFRGEAIYQAEVDVHFPQLSVGDTLAFAAEARAPRHIPGGVSREVYAKHIRDVLMAMFGISHTINTKVGNDFVRGVSGGERKRVSIAEAALSYAPLQCWDNSTRGLDSANALEFCKTLRMSTELLGATACVAIYQASQSAYDIFDKVAVLYEGRQIFFGPCDEASHYFEELGFSRPSRQTTADFLTSMTSSDERVVKKGFENRVPRTPDDFAAAWQRSEQRKVLLKELDTYDQKFPIGGESRQAFVESKRLQQAKGARPKSPYTMSYPQQVALCLKRGFWRLKGDPSLTFTQLFGNFAMALVIGSIFYNLQDVTSSFYSRGALLFFAILLNAFGSFLEILTLYAQRPIVEKHARYALYHPSAEAFASMLTDMPYKIANAIFFNLALYFLTNLRRTPGAFFFFLLISFTLTLTMSMMFRTIGSVSRSLPQAMAPAAIIIIGIVVYTGFVIPVPSMVGWSRWINYIDPVAYGFESLMINEFSGQDYACDQFIPSTAFPQYANVPAISRICSPVGSVAGNNFVSGTAYVEESFQYYPDHKWRNLGLIFVFMIGFMITYLIASELVSAKKSKGEVLLFRRGHAPAAVKKVMAQGDGDVEGAGGMATIEKTKTDVSAVIQKQTAIFHWQDVCYDIKIKGEPRRILDNVDGWVKPGTLTALMGVSGAGKTTLLDVLATRVTMGVVTGEMLVDGRLADESFQRKTGYVQQQDLHLQTTTVREALNFSALLRQSATIPRQEKLDYVTEVIKILEMEDYADAVVGVPGEGLNVEQRKRLTIGVELAAKPELLLFLDEPTSGLDSQTSWSICDLMEKLTQSGQAVLCTIHQPSAMLFQRFDRLLFLAKGGKTVYFGEIGENSDILLDYFKRNGGFDCPSDANPAEYMLEVIGAAPGSKTEIDWPAVWRKSDEYKKVKEHLEELKETLPEITKPAASADDKTSYREFAAPFGEQFREVLVRVYQQYWRTPSYIYSKLALSVFAPLFIGFSFYKADTSLQGLQDQVFSIFMLFIMFGSLVQQIMPHFVTQRALYESRERPSKAYSWKAFMLSNIIVELSWNFLAGTIIFFCWYYPIGFWRNAAAAGQLHERGALMWLLVLQFLLFTSSFTNLVIAGIPDAETGGNVANLAFSLTLVFCGVLATPAVFPGFWIFMYRLSPFTYLVSAMLSVGVANVPVVCATNELLNFQAPPGMDCGTYMSTYITEAGGYLINNATSNCQFCTVSETNTFLAGISSYYSQRWENYGILWAFIVFNIAGALAIYYLARVPKKNGLFGLKKKKQD